CRRKRVDLQYRGDGRRADAGGEVVRPRALLDYRVAIPQRPGERSERRAGVDGELRVDGECVRDAWSDVGDGVIRGDAGSSPQCEGRGGGDDGEVGSEGDKFGEISAAAIVESQ